MSAMQLRAERVIDGLSDTAFAATVEFDQSIRAIRPVESSPGRGQSFTVMPGMIDAHSHLSLSGADFDAWRNERSHATYALETLRNASLHLDAGETTVRDMGGVRDVVVRVRDAIKDGVVAGPTVYTSGQWLNVTGGHGDCYGCPADGVTGFAKATRKQLQNRVDFIKVMATAGALSEEGKDPDTLEIAPEELDAVFVVARNAGRDVAVHSHSNIGTIMAADRGAVSIEHGTWLSHEAIEQLVATGTILVPTLTIYQSMAPAYGGSPLRGREQAELMNRVMDAKMPWLEKAIAAGVRIAAGTDSGAPATPHGSVAHEIEMLMRAGMPAMQAIQAGTRVSGELVTKSQRGTLALGAPADLVIVRGDPLDDIRALKDVVAVIKDGQLVRGAVPLELLAE